MIYRYARITDVPLEMLASYDLLLFDLDNTLVHPETTTIPEDILRWFQSVENRSVIVSNSGSVEKRWEHLAEHLGEYFAHTSKKPSKKLFRQVLKKYPAKKVLVVGDRYLTDVLWAKRNGADALLIAPFSKKENMLIRMSRWVEQWL